jgi:hypothetical protein
MRGRLYSSQSRTTIQPFLEEPPKFEGATGDIFANGASMMRPSLLLALLVTLVSPYTANAATIVFFDENRSINASGVVQSSGDAGFWSASVSQNGATASQSTTISSSFVGGTGFAQRPDVDTAFASSFFGTSFTIDAPYMAHLDVDLFESGLGFTRVFLQNRTSPYELIWNDFGDPGLTTIMRDTLLGPGTYEFFLDASHGYPFSSTASFDGGFTLEPISGTEVPEPASMTLFGLGLCGVAARKLRGR